ncbi:MAG TPA: hypothetical protein VEZ15_02880 [Acidimicrobiia bacterium]|nr:hypothetical protein [Acidimicrobiia bacterium]
MTHVSTFVCTDEKLLEFPDVETAVEAALDLAAAHARVGVGVDPNGARRALARALPGMVCCPRTGTFGGVDCYPPTTTTALVTPADRAAGARRAHPSREAFAR